MSDLPKFPDIGCERDCGFERRGHGFQCVEGSACRRYVHPGDEHYEALREYDVEMTRLSERAVAEAQALRLERALAQALPGLPTPTIYEGIDLAHDPHGCTMIVAAEITPDGVKIIDMREVAWQPKPIEHAWRRIRVVLESTARRRADELHVEGWNAFVRRDRALDGSPLHGWQVLACKAVES